MQKSEIKVSVILPVYNVEKYLHECLDSIIAQTLKDIEIICVNDGSTDGSADILKEYARKDRRIIIIDQPNGGAGAARNNGLKAARGEYLSFLDADDFFEPDMLMIAYQKCQKNNADFSVFRSDTYNNESYRFEPCMWTVKDDLLPKKEVFSYKDIRRDIFKAFNGWAWDKLYRKSFVISNGLLFQEQRSTNDLYFVFSALISAQRITVSQKILAHHRRSLSESISVTREKSWQCFYYALLALRDKICSMGIYEEVKQSYINYALHFSLWNLNTIQGVTYEKLYTKLRDEYFETLGVNAFPEEGFFNSGEYEQYKRIKESPVVIYQLNEIEGCKKKIYSAENAEASKLSSRRTGRAIAFLPRMLSGFYYGCREYGFRYTVRYGLQIIHNLLRRNKK